VNTVKLNVLYALIAECQEASTSLQKNSMSSMLRMTKSFGNMLESLFLMAQ